MRGMIATAIASLCAAWLTGCATATSGAGAVQDLPLSGAFQVTETHAISYPEGCQARRFNRGVRVSQTHAVILLSCRARSHLGGFALVAGQRDFLDPLRGVTTPGFLSLLSPSTYVVATIPARGANVPSRRIRLLTVSGADGVGNHHVVGPEFARDDIVSLSTMTAPGAGLVFIRSLALETERGAAIRGQDVETIVHVFQWTGDSFDLLESVPDSRFPWCQGLSQCGLTAIIETSSGAIIVEYASQGEPGGPIRGLARVDLRGDRLVVLQNTRMPLQNWSPRYQVLETQSGWIAINGPGYGEDQYRLVRLDPDNLELAAFALRDSEARTRSAHPVAGLAGTPALGVVAVFNQDTGLELRRTSDFELLGVVGAADGFDASSINHVAPGRTADEFIAYRTDRLSVYRFRKR